MGNDVSIAHKQVYRETEIEIEEKASGKVEKIDFYASSSSVDASIIVNADVDVVQNQLSFPMEKNEIEDVDKGEAPQLSSLAPQEEQVVQKPFANDTVSSHIHDSKMGNEISRSKTESTNANVDVSTVEQEQKQEMNTKRNVSSKVSALVSSKSDSDRRYEEISCCFPLFRCLIHTKAADDDTRLAASNLLKSFRESNSNRHLSEYGIGLGLGSERDIFNASLRFRDLTVNEKNLLQHVHNGDKEHVRALLSLGIESDLARDDSAKVSVNCFDEDGWTPSHIACSKNDVEMLDLLLQFRADIKARECGWGLTPLSVAARDGSEDCVKLLLDKCVRNPDSFGDRYGFSALARAAHTGRMNTCKLLLDTGADPLHRDKIGFTPLHRAAAGGHTNVCVLIASYIDVDKRVDEYLRSRRNVATGGPFDWDYQDEETNNPDPSCEKVHCACMIFVYKGSRIDTPIHLAASHGHSEVVAALCKNQKEDENGNNNSNQSSIASSNNNNYRGSKTNIFSANCRGLSGAPPIHAAIRNGSLECVETLLKVGANPNISDIDGNTSLHVAVAYERGSICRLLIRNGADFELANADGDTPWELALQLNKFDMMTFLETSMRPDVALRRRQIRAAKMDPKSLIGKLINVQGKGVGRVQGTWKRFPFICQPKRFRISFLKNDRLNDLSTKTKDIILEQYDAEDGFSDGTPFFLVDEDISGSNQLNTVVSIAGT